MQLRVTQTTDGKYIGTVFDTGEGLPRELTAPDGSGVMAIERIIVLKHGFRFVNSNYIVECTEDV